MNPAAVAVQGVGYGALSMALQGFLAQLSPALYEKYISTIYKANSQDTVFKTLDAEIIYRAASYTEVDI